MPSERRLHPLSIVFNIIRQVGAMVVPLVVILIGRGTDEDRWNVYALIFLIPYTAVAVIRYLSFHYRYEADELVIRRGIVFRNQRHVPYDRIQNIDAVQNVLHRLLGVVDVRLQTAGSSEPEAVMSVLTLADLDEMRARVAAGRAGASGIAAPRAVDEWTSDAAAAGPDGLAPAAASAAPVAETLLHLGLRDLARYGLIENRGLIVIAAAMGLLWEIAAVPRFLERLADDYGTRTMVRRLARMVFVEGGPTTQVAIYGVVGLLVLLLVSRVFSVAWAIVRLYDFTLTASAGDLRVEYGLLTRVTATIPRRRIQSVTIRETPLHRLFGQASIRVATAGGGVGEGAKASEQREWLAPIIPAARAAALVARLVPGVDTTALDWQGVHPRAFGRAARRSLATAAVLTLFVWFAAGRAAFWIAPALTGWLLLQARLYVSHLGWTTTPTVAAFREGAWVRRTTIAPLAKIQSVSRHESPFDRRTAMARVRVDTAGGGHRIDVPYLPAATADRLHAELAAAAATSAFRW